MPVLLPPPIPTFSCSIRRTNGKRLRTNSTVPSVEPLSTTITSRSPTDSRQRSMWSRAFQVTTTTETSGCSIGDRSAPAEDVLPEQDAEAGQREQDRHDEEQETAREGLVGGHAELPEEADEERLAHADAVHRERHEHDEEEERPEHDVRQEREVDADGASRRVDREDAGELRRGGDQRDVEQRARIVAVFVQALVDRPRRYLQPQAPHERDDEAKAPANSRREDDEGDDDRAGDEAR